VVRGTLPHADGTAGFGISIDNWLAGQPAIVHLTSAVVEKNSSIGIVVYTSEAHIDASVVRDTLPHVSGHLGMGIYVVNDDPGAAMVPSTVASSFIAGNSDVGIYALASRATIESTVVRDTQPNADGTAGMGIGIDDDGNGTSSDVDVRDCLVDHVTDAGIMVWSSTARIEGTVVRDVLPLADGTFGRAINFVRDMQNVEPAPSALRYSLIERSTDCGVFVSGGEATVEGTLVRDTLPDGDGKFGRGIEIQDDTDELSGATATLRGCLFEQNREVGIFAYRSQVTIEGTVVRGTQPNGQGSGRGVHLQEESVATIRSSSIEDNIEFGVQVYASDLTIETSSIRATRARSDGLFGDGIGVTGTAGPASAKVLSTRVEASDRAAMTSHAAVVSLAGNALCCQQIDLDGEPFFGHPFHFEDLGGNGCGCPDTTGICQLVSAGLAPPDPFDPGQGAPQ